MPPIKFKINMGNKVNGTSSNPPSAAPRASPAPSNSSINSSIVAAHPMDPPTPGASLKKKNTIKFKPKSTPSTPLESIPQYPQPLPEPAPKKSKAGRTSKPSAKLVEANRKRVKDESDSDGEGSTIQVEQRAPNPSKKIKLSIGGGLKTPSVAVPSKIKTKGRPMQRKKGEGYDSEASDRELDPVIEEEFVLRMMPGDDCDYLRQMIADKKIGLSTRDGGADVRMKFFDQELRRVLIVIRGHMYAATLVDLPTIIEGMKSWDKRGWWKTADICQMLWVYARINREEEAKTLPLPKEVNPETHQYPHGLTPPMHYAQKRRFRKRISRTAIEAVEEAVNKLMAADDAADCIDTRFEMIDPDAGSRRPYSPGGSSRGDYDDGEEYSEDEDADGEVDDTGSGYFGNQNGITATPAAMDDLDALDALDADMEKELEAAFQEVAALESATPMSSGLAEGETPMNGVETPVGETPGAEDSGEDSVESGEDEEDEEDEEEIDEDEKARLAKLQTDKEDIADMERQLQDVQSALATQANPILKKRLEEQIRKIKAELQLKKSAMPEGEGADD